MPADRAERRLTTILCADVAGYSRLTGLDEEGTLARLRTVRRELIDPAIAEHRGRIVNTTGDGILVEFASVVDAVRCAVAVQRDMAVRNVEVPPGRRIEFRVGINLGDVVVERDGNLMGDGVNIAARLESIAEHGGICISEAGYQQVRDKVDVVFVDMGEQSLKNIERAVRVYAVGELGAAAAPTRPTLALPDKPSIAVLPFQNMSGDPEQEYFADGMVEEIITALARLKSFFVIARNSSFTYKGKAVDVKQVGRELGVRYVLEGSVRKAGHRVRITGQLIDAATGNHIWAERFEGNLEDIFDLQDRITTSVVGAIEPKLRQAEIERAQRKRPESLDAYDFYLRALPLAFTSMPDDSSKALDLLQKAIKLEPDYSAAHAVIAFCNEHRYMRGGQNEADRTAATRHARAAIAAGGDDPTALALAGFVIGVLEQDYEIALNALDRSLALCPSLASALGFSSVIRAFKGDSAMAIEHAERALRLSPFDQLSYVPFVGIAFAHFSTGHFEASALAAGKAAQSNPRFSIPLVIQSAALASLGRIEEGKVSARQLMEVQPNFTVNGFIATPFASRELFTALSKALRKLGLPE